MVTKTKTSTAVAVKAPTNIVSITEQLKAQAAAVAGKTEGGAKKVKFDRTTFTLPNGAMFQAPMRAVILDFNTQHILYENDYVEGRVSPIICAAKGDNPRAMVPYASIAAAQCDTCTGCWANEFGSKGTAAKACKQVRTMAMLVEGPDGIIDPQGPIFLMQTNVTANKVFDAFVKSVGAIFQQPPLGVIVSLGIDSSTKWNNVTYNNPVLNPDFAEHFGRQAEATAMLNEEVTVVPATPKQAAPARGKPATAARR